MAVGDKLGIEAVDELTTKTVPQLVEMVHEVLDRVELIISRLDGATITIALAPKK